MIAITIILTLLIINELVNMLIYGPFIIDKNLYESILQNKDKIRVNEFDRSIFYIGSSPYTSSSLSIIGHYYIKGIGIIPRWTKTHKLLKELHKKELFNF